MPLYEYECPTHGKFEKLEPMRSSTRDKIYSAICMNCGCVSLAVMSAMSWGMGFKFLKNKSEKSPPAPTDAGYHPEWDEAYAP